MSPTDEERAPLLQNGNGHADQHEEVISFGEDDEEDPKQWPLRWKYLQVVLIFILALICTLGSSYMGPAVSNIQETFKCSRQAVIAAQAVYVCSLGIFPLFWAPMSETFGRRPIFLINIALFTLVQMPCALAPNITTFIVFRFFSGVFGSVSVANGGGSISDMFEAEDRAIVLGFYLLGPLLGPTMGPLVGGLIAAEMQWRWMFWIFMAISGAVTILCFFLLNETNAVIILGKRKAKLESKHPDVKYTVEGASDQSLTSKVLANSNRAARILFTQPIVLTMSGYQALIFTSMYSLYSSFESIWGQYQFDTVQVALTYLGPTLGFIVAAAIFVPLIDRIYKRLEARNDGKGVPEFRLPLANIGAVLLPVSLFGFGWAIEYQQAWPIPIFATALFGASHVAIFNTVQNYYIDSFEKYAASALAAGAFLRSLVGGIIPLFVGKMFEEIGYGWGMSVFGFIGVVLMPAPLLFYFYGAKLRSKFAIDL